MTMKLAELICKQHYIYSDPKSCGRCPIQAACHAPVQPLTVATLGAYQRRMHDAAIAASSTYKEPTT